MKRKIKPSEQANTEQADRQQPVVNKKLAVAVQPPLFASAITSQPTPAPVQPSSIVLGRNQQTDAPITLGVEEMFVGTHVLGIPRHGKTALLSNMFIQLAEQGYGACYIDPHGDAINDLLGRLPRNREDDVIILDPTHEPSAFGLNLLHCDNVSSDNAITYAYNQLWSVFNKLWADKETGEMGIWMQKFVSNAILALLEHPGFTVCDIPMLLKSKAHREHVARSLKNREVAEFWLTEFDSLPKNYQWIEIESTLTRLNRFLQNPILRSIVGQSKSTLSFRQIMDTKKLLLVKIPRRLPDDFKTMLGTMLITQLLDAMFSRDDIAISQRVPFFLIVDEVERFAIPEFGAFFEEGGKYHVGTIAAHQHLLQEGLSASVRNGLLTAGNKVYLRVNDTDADIVAPGFAKAPVDLPVLTTTPADILPYLKTHQELFVRWVWREYISPLEEALAKEGIRYDKDVYMNFLGDRVVNVETIYPEWDFGSGGMQYEPDVVRRMRVAWNTLLCEAVEGELSADIVRSLWLKVVIGQSYFLGYQSYARFLYNNQTSLFTASAPREEIIEYERLKKMLELFARDDSNLMHFFHATYFDSPNNHLANSHWSKYKGCMKLFHESNTREQNRKAIPQLLKTSIQTKAEDIKRFFLEKVELYRNLSDRYQSLESYLSYLMPIYKNELEKSAARIFEILEDEVVSKHWWDPWWVKMLSERPSSVAKRQLPAQSVKLTGWYTDLQIKFESTIAEATAALSNPEHFFALMTKPKARAYTNKLFRWLYSENETPEKRKQLLTEYCREKYAWYEPRNTPAKLLAVTRRELEAEIEAIEAKLRPLYQQYNTTLVYRQANMDRRKAVEKSYHDRFVTILNELLSILKKPEYSIKVVASNYDQQGRRDKTAREMIDLMSGELRNLPKYTAYCKLVHETTTITHRISLLPLPQTHAQNLVSDLTAQIWQRMEAENYRPKDAIEKEILNRQELPTPASGASAFVKLPSITTENQNVQSSPPTDRRSNP